MQNLRNLKTLLATQSWKAEIIRTVFTILITVFVFQCILGISYVQGVSMEPNFHENDVVMCLRLKKPDYKDIAIIKSDNLDCYIIKRVIAKGGDTIAIKDGVTYLNGEKLDESYINLDEYSNMAEVTVPDGYYFVMGDNRPNSTDSRSSLVSFVSKNDVIGTVFLHI